MAVNYDVNGSDFTSINAACTEIEASHDYDTDGIANVNVSITTADTTLVTIDSASAGTPSSSAYIKIEATAAARHGGHWVTDKQRLDTTANGHSMVIDEQFVHLKFLQIKQSRTSETSHECIRVLSGANSCLIEKCVLINREGLSQNDCIYTGNWALDPLTIFDCAMQTITSERACIMLQNFNGSSSQVIHVEHCSLDADGAPSALGARDNSSGTQTVNVYNTLGFFAATADFDSDLGGGAADLVDGNRGIMAEDTTATGEFGSGANNFDGQTVSVTDAAATEILVVSLTAGSKDYQLLAGVNSADNAIGNAISGATQDSRIDLTVDIAGNPRPGTYTDRDCGCFEVVAGGLTVNVGLVTETDLAQSLGKAKAQAIGLTIETDLAQPLVPTQFINIGLVSESEVSQAFSALKQRAVGLLTEANLAQAFNKAKSKAIGLVSETDQVFSITVAGPKTVILGLILESNSLLALGKAKQRAIGLITETDLAQVLGVSKTAAVGLVTETDTIFAFGSAKAKAIGLVTETDRTFAFNSAKAKAVGLITEADSPLSTSVERAYQLGLVTETDLAFAASVAKAADIGILSESDVVFAMTATGPASPQAVSVQIAVDARNRRVIVEKRDRLIIVSARNRRIDVKKLN